MKKLAMIAGLAVLAAAFPASATVSPTQYDKSRNFNERQARAEMDLRRVSATGRLNANETAALRTKLRNIAMLEARYQASRPGITTRERLDLERRLTNFERTLHAFAQNRSYRR